jgi:HAD superfamily hydrolase (TIGR01509 family)
MNLNLDNMTNKKITHVLFDMDGVLLDTEPLYTLAYNNIAQQYGKKFGWDIKSKMLGLTKMDCARLLIESLQLPISVDKLLILQDIEFRKLFPDTTAVVGAIPLITNLSDNKIPIALATSSNVEFMEIKSKNHKDWFRRFSAIVTGDHPDVKNGKPAPDIFLVAAKCLNAAPESCLVFEDAPAGVRAAIAAGMSVIAIRDPHMDESLFADADEVLSCLTEFDGRKWGLPV